MRCCLSEISMSKMNAMLNERLAKAPAKDGKMHALAKRSVDGELSSFSGVFRLVKLTSEDRQSLERLLLHYQPPAETSTRHVNRDDLRLLERVTAEVRGIANQAAFLHGERIKQVQQLLLTYREGAFSSWLMAAYGNRQTPYNFLLYYELCVELDEPLRIKVEQLPKQVAYVLAGRPATFSAKKQFLERLPSSSREELLAMVRAAFPLNEADGRTARLDEVLSRAFDKLIKKVQQTPQTFTAPQKAHLRKQMRQLSQLLGFEE